MAKKFLDLIEDSGIMDKKFVEVVDVTFRTWKKRVEDPTDLTAKQIAALSKLLHITPGDLLKIILNN